jgi:hypothetical protein
MEEEQTSDESFFKHLMDILPDLSDLDIPEEVPPNKDEELKREFPPGYRFCPTDYELVKYYLIEKMLCHTLPWNLIAEVNVYDHTPEFLAGSFSNTLSS